MATITLVSDQVAGKVYSYTWEALGDADQGEALDSPGLADKTITVTGIYGGATLTLKGSNDGTNYMTIHDVFGNVMSFTNTNQIAMVAQCPKFMRPETSGGSGTDLDVIVLARKA